MNQRLPLTALLVLGGALLAASCTRSVSILESTGGGGAGSGGAGSGGAGSGCMTLCGHGLCQVLIDACTPQTCPQAMPEQESCNGVDDNCNGIIDEGCLCPPGATKRCYGGSAVTRGVGQCRDGAQGCVGDALGACTGDVLPAQEVCDGRDNDCDGIVDNGCSCTAGQQQPCYGGPDPSFQNSPCKAGVQTCGSDGTWGACQGQVLPTPEIIDGIDNDCNGEIDDGTTCPLGAQAPCYSGPPETKGIGVCHAGVQTCTAGGWSLCVGEVTPIAELCNGEDDDCNGIVDDGGFGASEPCTVVGAQGICSVGKKSCGTPANGEPKNPDGTHCGQVWFATPELCNGVDDDCDGVIDNGNFCCPDGQKDGKETDVDCGGPCPIKCAATKACKVGADCQSGSCVGLVCQ